MSCCLTFHPRDIKLDLLFNYSASVHSPRTSQIMSDIDEVESSHADDESDRKSASLVLVASSKNGEVSDPKPVSLVAVELADGFHIFETEVTLDETGRNKLLKKTCKSLKLDGTLRHIFSDTLRNIVRIRFITSPPRSCISNPDVNARVFKSSSVSGRCKIKPSEVLGANTLIYIEASKFEPVRGKEPETFRQSTRAIAYFEDDDENQTLYLPKEIGYVCPCSCKVSPIMFLALITANYFFIPPGQHS